MARKNRRVASAALGQISLGRLSIPNFEDFTVDYDDIGAPFHAYYSDNSITVTIGDDLGDYHFTWRASITIGNESSLAVESAHSSMYLEDAYEDMFDDLINGVPLSRCIVDFV